MEYFCKTKTKKVTLHNLHTFEKKKEVATDPSILIERESLTTSTKAQVKGLSKKEHEILEVLKDDPSMWQIFLQKILDKTNNLDDETVSSVASSTKPNPKDYQDSQDPYDLWLTKEKEPVGVMTIHVYKGRGSWQK